MVHRALLVLAFVISSIGCAAHAPLEPDEGDVVSEPIVSAEQSIVHGALDGGRHPSVVALLATDGSASRLCTGTLIAPAIVLTARHCVARTAAKEIVCPPRGPQVGRSMSASSIAVFATDRVEGSSPIAHGRAIFTPASDALCSADLAVMTLDRAITSVPVARILHKTPKVGDTITAVGFGRVGRAGREGIRRFRTDVPITAVSGAELVVGESTCSGDSGGPAFDEKSGALIGVLSRGSPDCEASWSRNVFTRVTPFASLIDSVMSTPIDEAPPKQALASDVGDPCTDASSCAAGLCVGEIGARHCSRPCGSGNARCPNGFRCAKSNLEVGVCSRT